MAQAIVAYLHYLSIFLLFALLVLQHRLLRLPLDLSAPAAWRRSTAATASAPWRYWPAGWRGCCGTARASTITCTMVCSTPRSGYSSSRPWSRCCRPLPPLAGAAPSRPAKCRRVVLAVRLQLLLLLVIPLLATLMARDFGMRG